MSPIDELILNEIAAAETINFIDDDEDGDIIDSLMDEMSEIF